MALPAVVLLNNDLLTNINQTSCEVTGVCGTKCSICKTLSGTVGGNEEVKHGKTLTEVCLDRNFVRHTVGLSHKSTHTCKLTDLVLITKGTGLVHHVDGVEVIKGLKQNLKNIIGALSPKLDGSA